MKNKLLLFPVWLLCSAFILGQAQRNLFNFDYAQFAYDSTSNYVEFYYSLNEDELTAQKVDNADYVEGTLRIIITDTLKQKPAINKEWSLKQPVNKSDSVAGRSLTGLLAFIIPRGYYNCSIKVIDKFDTTNEKTILDHFDVKPLSNDSLAVSDIQLASKIIQHSKDKKSIFYKNTFEVTPFPTAIYSKNTPAVFYYYEVYDHEITKSEQPYHLNIMVTNSQGRLFYNQTKLIKRHIDSRAEVGVIPITKFPTDIYSLKVAVLDSIHNYGMRTTKKFYVYNPSVKLVDTSNSVPSNVLTSAFGVLSQEECDNLFEKCKYIATEPEKKQYKKLRTLSGKRQFLYEFWKRRQSNSGSPESMDYRIFLKRVAESNKKYGSSLRAGWKTDRGRVLIMYGDPSEIDRYPNQDNTKPYEIWRYNNIEGGVYFVFADLTGFNDYELISSTKRGEIEDDQWQRRISANR